MVLWYCGLTGSPGSDYDLKTFFVGFGCGGFDLAIPVCVGVAWVTHGLNKLYYDQF